jgi:thiosulfate/3-mercaptopyruvate sulfurtransferase
MCLGHKSLKILMKHFLTFILLLLFSQKIVAEKALLDADWLIENLKSPHLYIVEVLSHEADDISNEYTPRSIKTVYSNDGWTDSFSELKDILPDFESLEDTVASMGISNKKHIILIAKKNDANTLSSTIRIYWILKMLGHDDVSILDGGFDAYKASGGDLVSRHIKPIRKLFKADINTRYLATTEEVIQAVRSDSTLIDLRLPSFYTGEDKHTLVDFSGSIPGAENVPWNELINEQGKFLARNQLQDVFSTVAGKATEEHIIFSETSHVAAIGWFILSELLNYDDVKIYDDGYLYWQSLPSTKIQNTHYEFGYSPIIKY